MYLLNRNGIYYYQRVTMCNGRRHTFRISLKTRDKAYAQLLALQIHFDIGPDTREHNSTLSLEARSVAPDVATVEPVAHGHIPSITNSEAVSPSGVESPALAAPSDHTPLDQEHKLSALIESYLAEKSLSWSLKEQTNQRNYIQTFIDRAGDKNPQDYTKFDAVGFKNWLLNSGKSPTTINKYLQKLSLLFSWLVDHLDTINTDPFKGLKLKRVKEVASREAYTDSELNTFDEWAQQQKPFRKWIALLGRYTGCRLNEVSQLYADDVQQIDGIWCLNIREGRPDQKLKTANSARLVPIHNKLIKLGLLSFVESRLGQRLFTELQFRQENYSHLYSQWFSRNKPCVDKDYHSLRHTIGSKLKAAGIPLQFAAAILGHSNGSISYDRYGGGVPISKLQEAIEAAL